MPKPHTLPTLYDQVFQISTTKLREWQYLNPQQIKSGSITWSRNEEQTGSISIRVNTLSKQPYIELDYKFKDEPRNYKVNLVTIPSNLGKGLIWYFICPSTKKRCRKLYSVGGYFLHREAFNGCMYESQIQSKSYRALDQTLGAYYRLDRCYTKIYSKHFKKFYKSKPTKKYLKLMKQIEQGERLSLRDAYNIEREIF